MRPSKQSLRFLTRLGNSQKLNSVAKATTGLAQSRLNNGVVVFRASRRYFADAAPAAAKPAKKNDSNIFLDNLGKIFLGVIAAIVATLVRSSYNTSNRHALRDNLEATAALDPVEIGEMRLANSELTPEVFRQIVQALNDAFPDQSCSYNDFTRVTRTSMVAMKGDAFTIQLGHLMDRVVAKVLEKYNKSADEPLPLALWITTLSLSLRSSVDDRMKVLFEALESQHTPVIFTQVEEAVGYLQDTCQLPSDTQIVPTDKKIPTQQWERGTPSQIVPWDGSKEDEMDFEAFRSILRSKSVCAWGECYFKRP